MSDNIKIEHKNTKSSNIRIDKKGIIKITLSKYISDKENKKFIEKNIDRFLKIQKNKIIYKKEFEIYIDKFNQIRLFDQDYSVLIEKSSRNKLEVNHDLKEIILFTKELEHDKINIVLRNLLKKEFKKEFQEIFEECFNNFKQIFNYQGKCNFGIKDYSAKWGICYYKRKEIFIAFRLLLFQKEIIKYVIYHELSHLLVHNHSKDFYQVFEKMVSKEKIREFDKILKTTINQGR